ncbi:MAG: biotin transporter BioY [Clostridia bacterium]|nr:biotin transporter BioY [Clostridia bacterium]
MKGASTYQNKTVAKAAQHTRDLTYIALTVGLISVCSWISVPTIVPFTLQTFAVFASVLLLGGKRGTIAILCYILLGLAGAPVFSNMTGGVGVLAGPTGGYIIGFLFVGLAYWLAETIFGKRLFAQITSLVIGLAVCYAFGTAWFVLVYGNSFGEISLASALTTCVVPFIPVDALKLACALLLTKSIEKRIKL